MITTAKRKKDFSKLMAEILAMEVPPAYIETLAPAREKGSIKARLALARSSGGLTVKELGALAMAAKFVEGDNTATNLVLTAIGEKPAEKEDSENIVKVLVENV